MSHRKPFASLIIALYNKLEFSQKCIDSILSDNDRSPIELIVIDNGSTDGTREYLESKKIELEKSRDVLIPIYNSQNLGCAPAWNQGLKLSSGQTIGILNNDILVTNGWYRSIVWAMELHGLQLCSPYASCGNLSYDLPERSKAFTRKNLGQLWKDYDFCAAVFSRNTFEKLGFFDENFLVGGYEDTDYIYRLRKERMKYGVTGASFIHHFGSQTLGDFKKLGDKHVAHNHDYFVKKWGIDPRKESATLSAKLRRSYRKLKMRWDYM